MFSRISFQACDSLKVVTYINIYIYLCFFLWNGIFSYRDIACISFFNYGLIYYLINVYSDSSQSALKYLKDTEVNINNVLIMTRDLNIRDSFWDLNFPYHSSHRNTLFDIADSFWLELSKPTKFFLLDTLTMSKIQIQSWTLYSYTIIPWNMTIIVFTQTGG